MNPHLSLLQPYPFERLRQLFADLTPPADKANISLSIGEPRHTAPAFVLAEIAANLERLSNYPTTAGIPELRRRSPAGCSAGSTCRSWTANSRYCRSAAPGRRCSLLPRR